MEKKLYELKIDPELRDFIPPLAESELAVLTECLLEEGCNEPLVVWNGVIVDGHNRYKICTENNIPFAIQEMEFESKEKAKMWMLRNQLGRRNLKPFQRCELVFPMEKSIEKEIEVRRRGAISRYRNTGETSLNLDESAGTGDYLAQYAGVSRATWFMARTVIEEGSEEIKDELRNSDLSISAAYKKIRKKEPAPKPREKAVEKPSEKNIPTQGTIEETVEEPSEESEPIVAARLDHPIPFIPVQRDDEKSGETSCQGDKVHAYRTDRIDEPFEVPPMRDDPMKEPRPFTFVKDQFWFAIENYLKELKIGLNWLRDEDVDKLPNLLKMIEDGHIRAKGLLKEMED